VRVLLATLAVVLMLPVLLLVAVAVGPVILVGLALIGTALVVWAIEGALARPSRRSPARPLHR
jgi:hypothetical protein